MARPPPPALALPLLLLLLLAGAVGCEEPAATADWRATLKTIRNGVHKIDTYLNAALDLLGGEDGLCRYRCRDGSKPFPRYGYKPSPPNGCGSPLFGVQPASRWWSSCSTVSSIWAASHTWTASELPAGVATRRLISEEVRHSEMARMENLTFAKELMFSQHKAA
ncbi:group XIIA secretory phospholipase A2 isoform X2 [Heterocephalus glaber]|uniref:Group XIIA secretory phospholipase A2 isoform X2 n=1 Tax=Heterocephalus glaber TaxID=10181 RepID=A0AAX6RV01_HETGA|nr:group XIIA secretory phospholipase A2 isoform X2 [Heterocephalus glaber]